MSTMMQAREHDLLVDVNKNIFVLTNSRVYANTSALRYRIEGIFILHVPNGVEL